MKLRSKAGVPIGTIAIIIIVLVAGIGMWWFFTQDGLDCSDVELNDTPDLDIYTIVSEADNLPLIQDFGPMAGLRYHFYYETPGGGALKTDYFESLDELENALDSLNIDNTDKKQAQLIIDCIRADCPDCQVG